MITHLMVYNVEVHSHMILLLVVTCLRIYSRGYESPDNEVAPEIPESQEEIVVDALVESYPGGSFYTFLLYLYGDHATIHVWE